MRQRKSQLRFLPDLTLLSTVLVILFFGIILVYDSSVVYAQDLFGGKYYLLILQSFWVVVSLVVALVASRIDYTHLKNYTSPFLMVSLILLLIVVIYKVLPDPWLGIYEIFVPEINGAHRWIYFNPKPLPSLPVLGRIGFQPSEFAKIALALYLATLFSSKKKGSIFFQALLAAFTFGGLVLLQPDFGTAAILIGISLAVFFVAGFSLRRLSLLLLVLFFLGSVFILSSNYRRQRLLTFLRPEQSDVLSSRYQINQILIALGSGGLTGLGLGKSIQKYGYIPEVSTDSIFSIVGEEFGFFGTTIMVVLFVFLIFRCLGVAERLPDEFGRYLAVGIAAFIGFQVFLNLFSMVHLIPLTGVPLPLVSYGGSSLVVNMFALGIVLSMSRRAVAEK